jgi:hypothetical protein
MVLSADSRTSFVRRVTQVWRCPVCGSTYQASLPILACWCPNAHPRGRGAMELIEGDPVQPTRKR